MLSNDSFQYLYSYKGKEHDTAIRVCLSQMNIIINTLNGTNKFMLTEKIGYDGKYPIQLCHYLYLITILHSFHRNGNLGWSIWIDHQWTC